MVGKLSFRGLIFALLGFAPGLQTSAVALEPAMHRIVYTTGFAYLSSLVELEMLCGSELRSSLRIAQRMEGSMIRTETVARRLNNYDLRATTRAMNLQSV